MIENVDLLIKGGTLVTGQGIQHGDLAVRGETIAAIGQDLPTEGCQRVIDATGKYVFPGIIDVHVHPVYLDDVEASSRVAAYGGTTTLAVGSDADLVIYDPTRAFTICSENQHSKVGYTLYEQRRVLGWPEMSFQRGQPVLEQGEIVRSAGRGQFLPTLASSTDPL